MKVFISWSGDISHEVALALHDWLPSVIQSLEPYVSSKDIDKGARWSTEISKELDNSSYGILCVTKDNLNAPWLNFEAGALSKSLSQRVSPFLFGVELAEINTGPILQFQATEFSEEDVKKLIHSLNNADDGHRLEENRVEEIFEVWWPRLEPKLKEKLKQIQISEPRSEKATDVSQGSNMSPEILLEVLELLHRQHRLLSSPEELIPSDYLRKVLNSHDRGIPIDHVASRDLDAVWTDFDLMLTSLDDEGSIPVSEIRALRNRMRRPIEFFTRHGRRPRGRARAFREPE